MTLDGVAKALPFAVGATTLAVAEPALAGEPIDCVLDSECPSGRCIDLVCVEPPRPPAKPTDTGTRAPSATPSAQVRVRGGFSAQGEGLRDSFASRTAPPRRR